MRVMKADGWMAIIYKGKVPSIYTHAPLHVLNTNQGVKPEPPSSKRIAHRRNQRTMRKAPPIARNDQHPIPTVVPSEATRPYWDWPHHHQRQTLARFRVSASAGN